MPKKNIDDWKPWHREMRVFTSRNTDGFAQDIRALEAHIQILQQVCPKDAAGWPVSTALNIITELQKKHETLLRYLEYSR